ncbi:hypothetical protein GQ42DRAFT_164705 [Ramicandelaber brevisporus]|nr:hypothetical protein GQ42DRAFT_164705 [Ramicandelaber brevisporus]
MQSRTLEFRDLAARQPAVPPPPSPPDDLAISEKPASSPADGPADPFLREAIAVVGLLDQLESVLRSTRPAYLQLHGSAAATATATTTAAAYGRSGIGSKPLHASRMTDQQRDELDDSAKSGIQTSLQRITRLEKLAESGDLPAPPMRLSKSERTALAKESNGIWAALTGGSQRERERKVKESQYTEMVRAHRAAVTWLLNVKLMAVVQLHGDMQEQRLNKQLERRKGIVQSVTGPIAPKGSSSSGGGGSSSSTVRSPVMSTSPTSLKSPTTLSPPPLPQPPHGSLIPTGGSSTARRSNQEGELRSRFSQPRFGNSAFGSSLTNEEGATMDQQQQQQQADAGTAGLTEQQMQQLQRENEQLLGELEGKLDQIRAIEQTVADIGAIQSAMAMHLAVQTQQIEKICEDAIAATNQVVQGNDYLRRTRDSNEGSRLYIMVLLLVLSFSLLFLDWYG